ncbi:Alkaline serine protease [Pseudoalteromonas luteoviolacea B = ATCC 29581]|nr:Alkaline serine protease [Pseudoalteromonas luteoviolacea B = ATCC 29581]
MKGNISTSIKKTTLASAVGVALSFTILAPAALAQADTQRVILTLKPTTQAMSKTDKSEQLNAFAYSKNLTPLKTLPSINAVVLNLTPQEQLTLWENGEVESIEEDPKRFLMAESTPYGITMTQADQLSDSLTGNRKVCIMDTGYTLNHEDLPSTGVTGNDGYGSNDTGNWYQDGNGHGTHVAGTIAAISNGKGVVGVNPSGQLGLHIVKVFNDSGRWAYGSDLIKAIEQCEAAGANVTSMSLGGGASSTAERNAFEQSYSRGMLHIAAAGNDGNSSLSYPASYDAVVSVAAVDSSENKASFSQYNNQVEIAGPGVNVNSTWNNGGYKSISGTSMATPHVSGVAALVWSHFPECSNTQIRNALNATAKDKGTSGRDTSYGFGIVQAKAAYNYLSQNRCDGVTQVTADFTYTVNGLSVSFTNSSSGASDYQWSFGDGQQSLATNPTHTYAAAGSFEVVLTASKAGKTAQKRISVTVTDGSSNTGCTGLAAWDANKTYQIGNKVSYKNYEYEAIWWSRAASPEVFSNVWRKGAKCN